MFSNLKLKARFCDSAEFGSSSTYSTLQSSTSPPHTTLFAFYPTLTKSTLNTTTLSLRVHCTPTPPLFITKYVYIEKVNILKFLNSQQFCDRLSPPPPPSLSALFCK